MSQAAESANPVIVQADCVVDSVTCSRFELYSARAFGVEHREQFSDGIELCS